MYVYFLWFLLAWSVAASELSPRERLQQERHENGTDAHGHNTGIPYWQLRGYTLNKNGTVSYQYRYTVDHKGRKIFNESAYDDIVKQIGCSVPREMLIDLIDIFYDHNDNHIFDPEEFPFLLTCLSGPVMVAIRQCKVKPSRMMTTCSVDGIRGVSASDFLMSTNCLNECWEQEFAYAFVFSRLVKKKCIINWNQTIDACEYFGKHTAEIVETKENLIMYGMDLKPPCKISDFDS